jgi:hypothetical protein
MNGDTSIISASEAVAFDAPPKITILSRICGQGLIERLSHENALADDEVVEPETVTGSRITLQRCFQISESEC